MSIPAVPANPYFGDVSDDLLKAVLDTRDEQIRDAECTVRDAQRRLDRLRASRAVAKAEFRRRKGGA